MTASMIRSSVGWSPTSTDPERERPISGAIDSVAAIGCDVTSQLRLVTSGDLLIRSSDNRLHTPTRRELLRAAAAAGIALPLAGPLARLAAAGPRLETYDDTSPGVPDGVEGDPERVIIVGAGWAGLTLANALRNAGVDHVLLEGRDRIGGRAYTADLGGVPIDLGCSFIHEPIGNPMARFADQAGVSRLRANVELDVAILRMYDAYLGRELNAVEKTARPRPRRLLPGLRGRRDRERARPRRVGSRRRPGLPRPQGPHRRRAAPGRVHDPVALRVHQQLRVGAPLALPLGPLGVAVHRGRAGRVSERRLSAPLERDGGQRGRAPAPSGVRGRALQARRAGARGGQGAQRARSGSRSAARMSSSRCRSGC